MIRGGEASVYSKFAYKKMEYDLIVSGDYDYNSHIGSISNETYRLESGTVRRESGTKTGSLSTVRAYTQHYVRRGIRMITFHSEILYHTGV